MSQKKQPFPKGEIIPHKGNSSRSRLHLAAHRQDTGHKADLLMAFEYRKFLEHDI